LRISSRTSPAFPSSRNMCPVRRECADGILITLVCGRSLVGSRRFHSRKASLAHIQWIEENVAGTLAGAVTTPASHAANSGGRATARRPGRGD
jgi:hypothetical protein